MSKQTFLLSVFLFTLCSAFALSAQEKIVVVAEKANIYAEPYEQALLIEAVAKGTVLTLFQKGRIQNSWYYVRFHSQRYGGPTTGFIKAEQVEPYSETTATVLPAPDKPPPPPVPEIKKEPESKTEELQAITSLPAHLVLTAPTEDITWGERTWIVIDISYTETPLPISRETFLPEQPPLLQDLPWRQDETKAVQTGLPATQIQEHRQAQDTLKTKVYAIPKPPLPEKTPPVSPPTSVSYSENIQLIRSAETLKFNLGFGPFSRFRHFELSDPNRIVVDFLDVRDYAELQRHRIDDLGLTSIRVAMFEDTIARVVFDFREEIPAYQVKETDTGLQLLFWAKAAGPVEQAEIQPTPKIAQKPEKETESEPVTDELPTDTDLPAPQVLALPGEHPLLTEQVWISREETPTPTLLSPGLNLVLPLTSPSLEERFWPAVPPYPEIETEPETRIEESPVDTFLPEAMVWALPSVYELPAEQVWTAWEEVFIYTAVIPGMVLTLPSTQPPHQGRFWTALPSSPARESKSEIPKILPGKKEQEKVLEKPEVEEKKNKEETDQQVIPKPQVSPPIRPSGTSGPITLSLGVGTSTGGAGGFVQYNTNIGFAIHAGVGMFPTSFVYSDTDWVKNEVFYSVGLKYYLPFKSQYFLPYMDVQYGGITIEAVQVIVGIWEYEYIYQNEQKALYGPSALLGGEIKLGTFGLNLAGGISYAVTPWEWKSQDFYFSFDVSLLYNFR